MKIRHTPGMLHKTCTGSAALMMLMAAGLATETLAQGSSNHSSPTYAADVASIILSLIHI